jgi:hypothetical protein
LHEDHDPAARLWVDAEQEPAVLGPRYVDGFRSLQVRLNRPVFRKLVGFVRLEEIIISLLALLRRERHAEALVDAVHVAEPESAWVAANVDVEKG